MPNFDSGSIMSYPLALRININKKQTNKQTELQCSAYLDVGQRYHLFQGPQQITLFFIIIIQNPLPFHHGCLSLEASNQISRLDFSDTFSVFIFSFSFIFVKACFQRLSYKMKCNSSFIVRALINGHLDIFSFLFYLASGNMTRQD